MSITIEVNMFRTLAITILLFAVSTTIGAQSANVIPLSAEDSTVLEKAWLNLKDSQMIWDKERDRVGSKYVSTKIRCSSGGGVVYGSSDVSPCVSITTPKGFEDGFEFSKDFKFIVPKQAPAQSPSVF